VEGTTGTINEHHKCIFWHSVLIHHIFVQDPRQSGHQLGFEIWWLVPPQGAAAGCHGALL
jgi:hypothetical protein